MALNKLILGDNLEILKTKESKTRIISDIWENGWILDGGHEKIAAEVIKLKVNRTVQQLINRH